MPKWFYSVTQAKVQILPLKKKIFILKGSLLKHKMFTCSASRKEKTGQTAFLFPSSFFLRTRTPPPQPPVMELWRYKFLRLGFSVEFLASNRLSQTLLQSEISDEKREEEDKTLSSAPSSIPFANYEFHKRRHRFFFLFVFSFLPFRLWSSQKKKKKNLDVCTQIARCWIHGEMIRQLFLFSHSKKKKNEFSFFPPCHWWTHYAVPCVCV